MPGSAQEKVKVTLLGESGVGKTSLVTFLKYGHFNAQYEETIGVDFVSHRVTDEFWLQFWDTAGLQRFQTLAPSYIHQSAVAIVVYDVSDRESFKQTSKWVQLARAESKHMPVFLVGNKCDTDRRTVSGVEGSNKASELDTFYVETSAKTGCNVQKLFDSVASEAKRLQQEAAGHGTQPREQWVRIDISVPPDRRSSAVSTSRGDTGDSGVAESCFPLFMHKLAEYGSRFFDYVVGREEKPPQTVSA